MKPTGQVGFRAGGGEREIPRPFHWVGISLPLPVSRCLNLLFHNEVTVALTSAQRYWTVSALFFKPSLFLSFLWETFSLGFR